MIDFLRQAYDLFLNVLRTLPEEWRAGWTGVVCCLLLTQYIKRYLPPTWTPRERSLAAELVGFAIGFVVVMLYDPTPDRALHATITGFAGPLIFRVVMAITSRRWPDITVALSQDN